MAQRVKLLVEDSYQLTQEERSVLEYVQRHPGASYREITQRMESSPENDYNFTDIQDGIENLRKHEMDILDRQTDGNLEHFWPGEDAAELLE